MKPDVTIVPERERVVPPPRYSFSPKVRKAVLLKSDGNCAKCGVKLGDVFDVDHILPLAHAGTNTIENLQALCKPCHRDKTDEDIGRIAKGNRQSKMGDPKPPTRIAAPVDQWGKNRPNRIKPKWAKRPLSNKAARSARSNEQ